MCQELQRESCFLTIGLFELCLFREEGTIIYLRDSEILRTCKECSFDYILCRSLTASVLIPCFLTRCQRLRWLIPSKCAAFTCTPPVLFRASIIIPFSISWHKDTQTEVIPSLFHVPRSLFESASFIASVPSRLF
jgi:hypothetical protein